MAQFDPGMPTSSPTSKKKTFFSQEGKKVGP